MARLQLALNVANLDEAVTFYSTLFRTAPTKLRPGYANFAISDPPLKLILFEGGEPGTINHLGVEVTSPPEVVVAMQQLSAAGLEVRPEESTTCCYAVQDKVWVNSPDHTPWEIYHVLADSDEVAGVEAESRVECCVNESRAVVVGDGHPSSLS